MKYVLIFWLFGIPYEGPSATPQSVAITAVEFNSKDACTTALEALVQNAGSRRSSGNCVAKGK
jgi:hypothetical protein